jgi:nucleotide-binding universal stress UspA family protein
MAEVAVSINIRVRRRTLPGGGSPMSLKDILVHVDSTPASRTRLRLGLTLARHFSAQLSGLHVIPEPDVPPYFKPSIVARIAKIYAENAREAADLAEALFREELKDAGAAAAWECVAGDMAEMITERARFTDLLMLGQFDTENPHGISAFLLPEKVVFGVASPILVVPSAGAFGDIGKRIVATWNGSREAARAIRDAMPLLKHAEQVLLLAVDLNRQGHIHDGADASQLAAHLGRHGIQIVVEEVSPGRATVAETLLTQAAEFGADLMVMGAYGHSRIWEFVVGGTTPDVLERTQIPVLISR